MAVSGVRAGDDVIVLWSLDVGHSLLNHSGGNRQNTFKQHVLRPLMLGYTVGVRGITST